MELTNTFEEVFWNNELEKRLCQLYEKEDVIDIFWGQNILTGDTSWSIYVVTRNFPYKNEKIEIVGNQVIQFISEEKGFIGAEIPPQGPYDPLPTRKKVPQDLQKTFDEALNYELGTSFREMHYNLVGMSTGYKRTQGKFTDEPAIKLYVRQKGILRRGCSLFPDKIRGYPVDVVEACVATPYGLGKIQCQTYHNNVKLGSSIGVIEPQRTSGSLSAVVYDKKSKRIGILTCEHVCKFSESSSGTNVIIHQPSHEDLDEQKQLFLFMTENEEALEKNIYNMFNKIRQCSALACYDRGMQKNFFSKVHQKDFGIDVAFCIFTYKNRTLCLNNQFAVSPDYFKEVNLPENGGCLNGYYTYEMFDEIDGEIEVFKVGKTTGLSCGKMVPITAAISIDLSNKSIKFAKGEDQGEIPPSSNITKKKCFIGYMKTPLIQELYKIRQQCYPTVWFDRQLVFYFRYEDFKPGDSGASVLDVKGKALGILHSKWLTAEFSYVIASPYFAVLEALNVDFEKISNSVV
ncbi:hypothetical protein Glove_198g59 [Diversispora epigaea]|uniref:Peptidase S7 domain-containing protein n=1 Tax=Diversispora epigaea TaxID=1348612 RepID=A0A397ITZ1_9GLOM|nr:hypothetical protein Glove_198g59 [Diversispora epigaea]